MPRARGGGEEGGRQAADGEHDGGRLLVIVSLFDKSRDSRAGVAFLRQLLADAVDADWAASEERAARRKRVPGRDEGAATEVVAPWLPPSPNTSDYCPSNGAFEFCPVFQGTVKMNSTVVLRTTGVEACFDEVSIKFTQTAPGGLDGGDRWG